MESIQQIKGRIQTIGSTRQITQSMRLVSTAKVQRARARMTDNRPFFDGVLDLLREVAGADPDPRHLFLSPPGGDGAAVIVLSSDRGLCGGFNIGVCKEAAALMEEHPDCRLITVGVKSRDYFRRRRRPADESFTGISENPFFDDAARIAAVALDLYEGGLVREVHLVYTRFQSLLVQTPVRRRLLPLEAVPAPQGAIRTPARCEPETDLLLDQLVPYATASLIYGGMLESAACEQAARITSMDTAVKNSDEMIEALTLRYNQARQGAITQEITEIVGGAEALEYRKEG